MAKLTFDDEFSSLDAGTAGSGKPWEYSWDYAPNGFSDSTMSSFEMNPNTSGMPADANTYSVSNGILSMGIKNTPSDVPGSLVSNKPFLSSEINTKNEFSQTYGYFEVRMQTEAVTGTSVAFWALPQNGSWPPEIDMPEIEGEWPSYINWGMHSGPNNTTPLLWDYNAPNTSAGMNVFAVDWEPNTVTFYLNGKVEYQEATPSDWNTPMYLLLDTIASASGSWNGTPPSTINTALKVDYVRAYNSNPYVNGLTNPDWTNHGTTATTYTPVVNASGNLTGFSNGSAPTSPPAKPPQSPDNTVITAAQAAKGASITDASGNVWSIASNGEVSVNGTPDGQSANVIELAYEKGLIWQENSADMWWSKSSPSGTWGPTSGTSTSPIPASTSPTVSPDQLVLVLSEDAYQGNAQFIVKMDGTQLGAAQSVTASHSAGQTQNFTLSGTWGAGAHSVEIDFINDAYAGPGQDRNLYVNQVTYDGHAAMTATDALYSNGGVTIHVS